MSKHRTTYPTHQEADNDGWVSPREARRMFYRAAQENDAFTYELGCIRVDLGGGHEAVVSIEPLANVIAPNTSTLFEMRVRFYRLGTCEWPGGRRPEALKRRPTLRLTKGASLWFTEARNKGGGTGAFAHYLRKDEIAAGLSEAVRWAEERLAVEREQFGLTDKPAPKRLQYLSRRDARRWSQLHVKTGRTPSATESRPAPHLGAPGLSVFR